MDNSASLVIGFVIGVAFGLFVIPNVKGPYYWFRKERPERKINLPKFEVGDVIKSKIDDPFKEADYYFVVKEIRSTEDGSRYYYKCDVVKSKRRFVHIDDFMDYYKSNKGTFESSYSEYTLENNKLMWKRGKGK